jgi:hypothetical protein
MKPENKSPLSSYAVVVGIAGQVGCLLILVVGGALLLGLAVDKLLNTGALFLFLAMLGSIPLNLWLIYKYTLYRTKQLQASQPPKEEEDT